MLYTSIEHENDRYNKMMRIVVAHAAASLEKPMTDLQELCAQQLHLVVKSNNQTLW